MTSGRLAGHV